MPYRFQRTEQSQRPRCAALRREIRSREVIVALKGVNRMRRLLLFALVFFSSVADGAGTATADPLAIEKASLQTQRPDPVGIPTPVEVRTFVADVFDIDNIDQAFSADIYVSATWKDPRLAGATTRKLALTDVWHPSFSIVNERDLDELLPFVVTVEPDGQVTYEQRLIGSLSARMDLREFPYDRQTLSVSIVSLGYTPEEVELWTASELTEGFEDFSISDWHVTLQRSVVKPIVIPSTGKHLSHVEYQMGAERYFGYYLWVMYVPLVFIVLMAWMVFWIDPSLIPSQIALSTASVFSLIAFRFSIRLSLPAVSYMTRIDQFVLGCTVLVFLALGQAVMTGRLAKQGREDLARRLDQWGRWLYLAAFVLIVAVYR